MDHISPHWPDKVRYREEKRTTERDRERVAVCESVFECESVCERERDCVLSLSVFVYESGCECGVCERV